MTTFTPIEKKRPVSPASSYSDQDVRSSPDIGLPAWKGKNGRTTSRKEKKNNHLVRKCPRAVSRRGYRDVPGSFSPFNRTNFSECWITKSVSANSDIIPRDFRRVSADTDNLVVMEFERNDSLFNGLWAVYIGKDWYSIEVTDRTSRYINFRQHLLDENGEEITVRLGHLVYR